MNNARRPPSLGSQIDHLYELREQIRDLSKRVDELKSQKAVLEDELIQSMDTQGTDQLRGAKASASVSEIIVPRIEDWDAVHRYVKRNNAFYLLERRLAAAPYRELLSTRNGKDIPGTKPFTKRSINLRKR